MSNEPAIFIADFPNQLIREKIMMEKPHPNGYDGHKGYYLDDMEDYTAHINSRRTYPYPVSKEQDGKEIKESEIFFRYLTRTGEDGVWYDISEDAYNRTKDKSRRIIAIPIDKLAHKNINHYVRCIDSLLNDAVDTLSENDFFDLCNDVKDSCDIRLNGETIKNEM